MVGESAYQGERDGNERPFLEAVNYVVASWRVYRSVYAMPIKAATRQSDRSDRETDHDLFRVEPRSNRWVSPITAGCRIVRDSQVFFYFFLSLWFSQSSFYLLKWLPQKNETNGLNLKLIVDLILRSWHQICYWHWVCERHLIYIN